MTHYCDEHLDPLDDDGTMTSSKEELEKAVVGHRIVAVRQETNTGSWTYGPQFVIELDNGRKVIMRNTSDCCAFTELGKFLLNVDKVNHIITGVGTTEGYQVWHIYADMGDVLQLDVSWSCGNPFYYGYGFDIEVVDPE